jgi:hypothetical protein
VSDHDFVFTLDLSDPPQFDAMLAELARAVCAHVGYEAGPAGELTVTVQTALGQAAAGQTRCAVRFEAHAGELRVAISTDNGAVWRTSRPLP